MSTIARHCAKPTHYVSMVAVGVYAMSFTGLIHRVGLTDFCVDSNINIQQAFILTQIKSLFPLLLIALTYTCIQLHNRNYKVIVWLLKPFCRCFTHYGEVWNPKLSLVDAFSTYLLLFYSRCAVLYIQLSAYIQSTRRLEWDDQVDVQPISSVFRSP